MAEKTGAAPPAAAEPPPPDKPAVTQKKTDEYIGSKQRIFSGFNGLKSAPPFRYTIRVTLKPRSQGGKVIESYEKIAWTASVIHFLQVLKIDDPDVMFTRKLETGNGPPIATEADVPDSTDIFAREYAYNVRDAAFKVTFHIGICSNYSFNDLFHNPSGTIMHKLKIYKWDVVQDRVQKIGSSIVIGYLQGANPRFINATRCLEEIKYLLLDRCQDVDVVPKMYYPQERPLDGTPPPPPPPSSKKQKNQKKIKRVTVKTLAVTCPHDISEDLSELIMQQWGIMADNPEFEGLGIRHYRFIPEHSYYTEGRENFEVSLLNHKVAIEQQSAAVITNCGTVDYEFEATEDLLNALELLPKDKKVDFPKGKITMKELFSHIGSGPPGTPNNERIVFHTEQYSHVVVHVLTTQHFHQRLRYLLFNFLEALSKHENYSAISGGTDGAIPGMRFRSQAAVNYMNKIRGTTNPNLRRETYVNASNVKNPYARRPRPQLRISNGPNHKTALYSDIVKQQPATKTNVSNNKHKKSTSIVIAGSNNGQITTQHGNTQAPAPTNTSMTRTSAVSVPESVKQVVTDFIRKEIALQGSSVTRALAEMKRKTDATRDAINKMDERFEASEQQWQEEREARQAMQVEVQKGLNSLAYTQENSAKMMQASMQESMKMMEQMRNLMNDFNVKTKKMDGVNYERDDLKEQQVHKREAGADATTPTSSLQRRKITPQKDQAFHAPVPQVTEIMELDDDGESCVTEVFNLEEERKRNIGGLAGGNEIVDLNEEITMEQIGACFNPESTHDATAPTQLYTQQSEQDASHMGKGK